MLSSHTQRGQVVEEGKWEEKGGGEKSGQLLNGCKKVMRGKKGKDDAFWSSKRGEREKGECLFALLLSHGWVSLWTLISPLFHLEKAEGGEREDDTMWSSSLPPSLPPSSAQFSLTDQEGKKEICSPHLPECHR